MRYSIIFALVTAVSALDVRYFGEAHCKGSFGVACTGVNPHGCCGGQRSDGWAAVGFANIPSNWDILSDGYAGDNCHDDSRVNEFRNNGNTFICHGDNRHYKSAAYRFFGKKKRGGSLAARDVSDEECLKPNELFLADSTVYNIAGLEAEQIDEFLTLAADNASHADLPAVYQVLKIE